MNEPAAITPPDATPPANRPPRQLVRPHRCPGCAIRKALCFCHLIPSIAIETRVIILMHTSEEVLSSNTARRAARSLVNSEIRINGRLGDRLFRDDLVQPGRQSLLLYPTLQAAELNADYVSRLSGPFNLIVPDGSWRQTQKLARREPALAGIPQVKIPLGPPSQYRLRNQANDFGLCTMEAIARALGVLESCEIQTQLEMILKVMVERTLWSRGRLPASECSAGIPLEARQSLVPSTPDV